MKQLLIIALSVSLLLVGLAPAVTAQSTDDLAALFPESTSIYASVRTDDGVIETLDGLFTQIASQVPGVPPVSLGLLLDQGALELSGGTGDFATAIRSWLGDQAAVGVLSLDDLESDPPVVAIAQISDQKAAADFVRGLPDFDLVEASEGGVITFSDPFDAATIQIAEDTLFIANNAGLKTISVGFDSSLADNAAFSEALALLPAESYLATMYIDTPAFVAVAMEAAAAEDPTMPDLSALTGASGPQAAGLTVLGGGVIALDTVQLAGDTSELEAIGFSNFVSTTPLDPAFAAHIPGDSLLVAQATEAGPTALAALDNLSAFGGVLQGLIEQGIESGQIDREAAFLANVNFGTSMKAFINLSFAGMTGLNLENDVLAWMTGDSAFAIRVLPDEAIEFGVVPDILFAIEATDPEAAANVVSGLGNAFEQFELSFIEETAGVLAFPGVLTNLLDLPQTGNLDILIGANDDVLAMGTRPGVRYALAPDGPSLADNEVFIAAQDNFVEDASTIMFVNLAQVANLLEANLGDQPDIGIVLAGLNAFPSMSVSAASAADGASVARFALSLGG